MMPPQDDMEEEVIVQESQPESIDEDTIYIESGIFISLFNCSNSTQALFIRSLTNAECRADDNISVFFRAFAVAVPLNYSKTPQKFVAGVPYKFKTVYRSIIAYELADEAPYNIVDSYCDIAVLKPEDKTVKHPCVYGAFVEQDESFCTFQVTEKPNPQLLRKSYHKDSRESSHKPLVLPARQRPSAIDSLASTRKGASSHVWPASPLYVAKGTSRPSPCETSHRSNSLTALPKSLKSSSSLGEPTTLTSRYL
jgi:hypothetical protein